MSADDDYDNDDFEAYEDDFDDHSQPQPKSINDNVKPGVKGEAMKPTNSMNDIIRSMQNENMAALSKRQEIDNIDDSKESKSDSKPKESKSLTNRFIKKMNSSNILDDEDDVIVSHSNQGRPTTASKRIKKYGGSLGLSSAGTLTLDPRYRRLSKLQEIGVLDLQEEKFSHANILPSTLYDLYNRQLRSQQPLIKQVGAPNDLETRDIEIGTEEIAMVDKELQFSYGDDTTFFDVIQAIKESKSSQDKKSRVQDVLLQSKGQSVVSSAFGNESTDEIFNGAGSKLADFLQKSSALIESLLDESDDFLSHIVSDRSKGNTNKGNLFEGGVFQDDVKWRFLGETIGNGANELIRNRSTVVVKHSDIQPSFLLTAHPAPILSLEDDLRPFKALYAIWEVSNTAAPVYVLESHGSPTCATFSKSQTHLVVAGTAEGCLYMWDLREPASHHKDRDSIDLKIERGIRKPCYSTLFMIGGDLTGVSASKSKRANASNQSESVSSHYLPIVQVESLGDPAASSGSSASVVSQFISLDTSGLVLIWITSHDDNIGSDPGMSPWSQVKLVPSRSMNTLVTNIKYNPNIRLPENAAIGRKGQGSAAGKGRKPMDEEEDMLLGPNQDSKQFATCLAPLPGDLSSFMVANFDEVHRISRYGEAPDPNRFDRIENQIAGIEILSQSPRSSAVSGQPVEEEVIYKGFVTSISTAILQGASNVMRGGKAKDYEIAELMLVGRSDGGIDLFRLNHAYPICSWNITDYDKPSSKSGKSSVSMPRNASVVSIKWCPNRKSAFFVIDNHGILYYFDLLENFDAPVSMDSLGVNISSQSLSVEAYLSSSSPLNSASPKGPAYPTLIDISQCRVGSKLSHIAVVDSGGSKTGPSKGPSNTSTKSTACNVKVRRIREEVFKSESNEEQSFLKLIDERVGKLDNIITAKVIRSDQSNKK